MKNEVKVSRYMAIHLAQLCVPPGLPGRAGARKCGRNLFKIHMETPEDVEKIRMSGLEIDVAAYGNTGKWKNPYETATDIDKEAVLNNSHRKQLPPYIKEKTYEGRHLVFAGSYDTMTEENQTYVRTVFPKLSGLSLYRKNPNGSLVLDVTEQVWYDGFNCNGFPTVPKTGVQEFVDRAWFLNEQSRLACIEHSFATKLFPFSTFFQAYRDGEEIEAFMNQLACLAKGKQVTISNLATTIEGRSVVAVKVQQEARAPKPAIVIIAGQSGSEWIGISSALYALYDSCFDERYEQILSKFDLIVVPIVNPDGFYQSHTVDIMDTCRFNSNHVDLKENWADPSDKNELSFHPFRKTSTPAFSEIETRALRDYIEGLPGVAGLLDLHNYSMRIVKPCDTPELTTIGDALAKTLSDGTCLPPRITIREKSVLSTSPPGAAEYFYAKLKVPCFTVFVPPAFECFTEQVCGTTLELHPPPNMMEKAAKQFSKCLVEFANVLLHH